MHGDPSTLPPDLVVVGTLALDDIETPSGTRRGVLGGSAVYFGVAASRFARVGLVGVVGADFPSEHRALLTGRGIDLAGLEVESEGRTFHWAGRYEGTMDQAETLATDLNVLASFAPRLPEAYRAAPYVFLANTDPEIQASVLDQLRSPRLVAMDTMNLWIRIARPTLLKVLCRVDGLIINDAEARQLTGIPNLIKAAREILSWGPKALIIKRGEYGAAMFTKDSYFAIPAYPLESVFDPTGAGDTFAGGLMGYLASQRNLDEAALRRAMIFGSVMASFNVEEFGTERVRRLTHEEINQRFHEFKRFTHFEEVPFERAARVTT